MKQTYLLIISVSFTLSLINGRLKTCLKIKEGKIKYNLFNSFSVAIHTTRTPPTPKIKCRMEAARRQLEYYNPPTKYPASLRK